MKLDFLYTRQQPYQKRKIQRYDFCFLRRALGPPNFLDSVCLLSPDSRCLSYSAIFLLISSRMLFVRGCSFGCTILYKGEGEGWAFLFLFPNPPPPPFFFLFSPPRFPFFFWAPRLCV